MTMCDILHVSDYNLGLLYPAVVDSPVKLSKLITTEYKNTRVFLIYVNYKSSGIERADNAGILLLKYLRLYGMVQHCVLYSFLSREQLMMQDPNNAIIFSKGVTFVRLPGELTSLDFTALEGKKAPDNLSEYFQGEIDLSQIRHSLANIYGLRFMCNIHNKYFPEKVNLCENNSAWMSEKPSYYQLAIADYLLLNKSFESSERNTLIEKIKKLQKSIRDKHPNILYIDDKAALGWEDFLKKAITQNGDTENHITRVPEKEDFSTEESLNKFFEVIKKDISSFNPLSSCILLDLRLADETGDIDELDNLSGIRLLKKIHEAYPAVPVIIFTASNKAKSVKKIIECGAEALWTKPGVEEIKSESFYLDSYCELLNNIFTAINKYKTKTDKDIVTAQLKIESIREYNYNPEEFTNVNIILIDTSFWCANLTYLVQNHMLIRRLLNVPKESRIENVVIEDVLQELYIKAKQRNNPELKIAAQFALEILWKYLEQGLISTDYSSVQDAINQSIKWSVNSINKDLYQVVSTVNRIHACYTLMSDAYKDAYEIKSDKKTILHADDTFSMLIPYYMKKGKNVFFLSNDLQSWERIIASIYQNDFQQKYFDNDKIVEIRANGSFCKFACSTALTNIFQGYE